LRRFLPWIEPLEERILLASTPVATLSAPTEALLGQNLTLSVVFDNTSGNETGHGPFVDLILPAPGKDGNDGINFNPSTPAFNTITYAGIPLTYTTVNFAGGQAFHPYARQADGTPAVISGTTGYQLVSILLPFNAFTPDQPTATVTVTAGLSPSADVGAAGALTLKARGGFVYGNDVFDNPAIDPSIFQPAYSTAVVTPTIFTFTTTAAAATATGPNYPVTYTVSVTVAAGQTVTNLDLTAILPANLQFVQTGTITPAGSTAISTPSTTAPGGTLTRRFASLSGTASMAYTVYAPLLDAAGNPVLDPNTGAPRTAVTDAKAQANWTPTDLRDPAGPVTSDSTPADHTLTLLSLQALQSMAMVANVGDPGSTPGDTLEYTLTLQVSDYFSFNALALTDTISDGQRFAASFVPTLQVNGNLFTLSTSTFAGANYTVTPHYSAPPGDGNPNDGTNGTTDFQFLVSNEMITRGQNGRLLGGLVSPSGSGIGPAPGDGATTATVKFRTIVQEAYTDAYALPNHIVKQGDTLTAGGTGSGAVLSNTTFLPTGNTVSTNHSASVAVPTGGLTTTLYAINGNTTVPANALLKAGDLVTYRLKYALRTSDVRNLSFTDFLPLSALNAGALTTFNYSVAGIPAVNTADLGPLDTFKSTFPSVTPTMTTTTANGNNYVTFTYGDNSDPLDRQPVIDILFTLQISTAPLPDGWFLTNLVVATEQGSSTVTTQQAVRRDTLAEPLLRVTKGAVTSDNANAVFFPANVGPAGVTFGAPGSATSFTGTITSPGLASRPVNSDITVGADAGDRVRFAIVIENLGRGPNGAYDARVQDTLPAGFAIPSGGLNLKVTDGTGAAISTTDLGGGLFGNGLELSDPGPTTTPPGGLDPGKDANGNTVGTGRNIAVLTYDLQVVDTISSQSLTNTATLLRYATAEGGPTFTAGQTDTASVTIRPKVAKALTASNQTFTSGANLAVGEIGTYQVTVTVPEGVTSSATLVDNLPAGLALVALDSLAASAAVQTSVSDGFPAILRSAVVGAGGSSATLNFGTLTNTDRNNAAAETIVLTCRVVVLNVSANQRNTVDSNSVTFSWNTGSTTGSTPITLVTPGLQVSVTPSPTTGDAGDTATWTLVLSHVGASNANAYNVTLSDVLPAKLGYLASSLTYVSGLAPDAGSLQFSGGTIAAAYATFATGQTSTLRFQTTVAADIAFAEPVADSATLKWTSLPGVVTSPQSPYNTLSTERTGNPADPGGAANNFTATGTGTVTGLSPVVTKTVVGTNQAFTTGNNVAVGEQVQYQVRFTVPEGVTANVTLTDPLPAGMAVVSVDSVSASAAVTTSHTGGFPGVRTDAAVAAGGGSVTFAFNTLTNTDRNNGVSETVTVLLTAVVLNAAGNQNAVPLRNQATLSYPNGAAAGSAPDLTVLEPALQLTQTAAPTAGDAGGAALTFTLVVAHAAGSATHAYDLALTDVLPAGLTYVANSLTTTAGLAPTALGAAGATLSATWSGFPSGSTSTLTFQATLNGTTSPGQTVTNTATVTYTSLPGVVTTPQSTYHSASTERTGNPGDPGTPNGSVNDYSTSGSAAVTVYTDTLSGFVYDDVNNNGQLDAGEAGISAVLLTLTGTDNLGNAVNRTATTDAAGAYSFPLLRPGSYTVQETQPPGYVDGQDTVGSPGLGATNAVNDRLGTFSFPLGASTTSGNNNFGEGGSWFTGRVFVDRNWNGRFDAGEAGLAGVVVTLKDAAGATLGTRTTLADGTYNFGSLAAGLYVVVETQPAG
jgi:fimbrial isopeptide formation D2 family protein/uncharacterized repeat protein (TIGR01451 family)